MYVFFDLDRTLMNFELGEDMGIKIIFETYKKDIKMNYEEFKSTWKVIAQKTFDEYSAGLHTFDQQRHLRVYRMFEANGVKLSSEETDKRFALYWSTYEKGVDLFSDSLNILNNLKNHDIPMGLISNGDVSNQYWKLNKVKITSYFNPIIISGEVGISKPDLGIFEIALKKAGTDKKNCWYIGDSMVHDIEPALQFGLNVIYLNRKMDKDEILYHKKDENVYAEVKSLDHAWKVLENYL